VHLRRRPSEASVRVDGLILRQKSYIVIMHQACALSARAGPLRSPQHADKLDRAPDTFVSAVARCP
jgi:hypothetical protein